MICKLARLESQNTVNFETREICLGSWANAKRGSSWVNARAHIIRRDTYYLCRYEFFPIFLFFFFFLLLRLSANSVPCDWETNSVEKIDSLVIVKNVHYSSLRLTAFLFFYLTRKLWKRFHKYNIILKVCAWEYLKLRNLILDFCKILFLVNLLPIDIQIATDTIL